MIHASLHTYTTIPEQNGVLKLSPFNEVIIGRQARQHDDPELCAADHCEDGAPVVWRHSLCLPVRQCDRQHVHKTAEMTSDTASYHKADSDDTVNTKDIM